MFFQHKDQQMNYKCKRINQRRHKYNYKKQTGSLKNIEHSGDYVPFDELYNNYYDYSINSIEYTNDESKNNIETIDKLRDNT